MRKLQEIRRTAGVLLILGACGSILLAQEPSTAFNFPDFTAIQKIGTGSKALLMKVYFSGSTVRVESTPTISNLFVTSTGKVYRLVTYPDKGKSCVVMRRDQERFMASPLEMLQGTKVERTPAGTDVVDGHKCRVEDVVVTRADGKVMKSKVWEAEEFKGVPIKIISEVNPDTKIAALYGDIVFEKVDPALLTPPDKCTPIEKEGQVVEHKIIK